MSRDFDDLLQPSITAPVQKSGKLPWRVSSQFWVAFFGGVLAATPIAYINSLRLGAPKRVRQWIVISGIVATALYAGCFAIWFPAEPRIVRFAGRVVAVLQYLVLARIQRGDDNRHQIFGSGAYASLWVPGLIAIVAAVAFVFGLVVIVRMALQ
jgi:hypothetical protein